ncbi:MAG: hypothetical protein GTO18_15865 [Anaerolineales bacterium]|nr:hypothetical protein [Anaerolineales bacterium]
MPQILKNEEVVEEAGGEIRDLHIPACVVQVLGYFNQWPGEGACRFPKDISGLPVYKCRQMFLLVLPGIQ